MTNDFYINGVGAGEYGARLLANYKVGGTPIKRTRQKTPGVQGWLALQTEYGLRTITLPIHVQGKTPLQASLQLSELTAALSAEPVDLHLPNGMQYFASLDSAGDAAELTQDGSLLSCTYKLAGYAHGDLQSVTIPPNGTLRAIGTAPHMACKISCTVGKGAGSYPMAGVVWKNVQAGDKLEIDGLTKCVTRNGYSDIGRTDLTEWPTLTPGKNTITAQDALTVSYYPIWL